MKNKPINVTLGLYTFGNMLECAANFACKSTKKKSM